jgi:hypothetical protein
MKLNVTVVQGCTEQQVYKTYCDNQKHLPGCHNQLCWMHVALVLATIIGGCFVLYLLCSRIHWPLARITVWLLLPIFDRRAVHIPAPKEG